MNIGVKVFYLELKDYYPLQSDEQIESKLREMMFKLEDEIGIRLQVNFCLSNNLFLVQKQKKK